MRWWIPLARGQTKTSSPPDSASASASTAQHDPPQTAIIKRFPGPPLPRASSPPRIIASRPSTRLLRFRPRLSHEIPNEPPRGKSARGGENTQAETRGTGTRKGRRRRHSHARLRRRAGGRCSAPGGGGADRARHWRRRTPARGSEEREARAVL
jgi:hypothetical protein